MAWDIAEELIERLGDKLEVGGANIPDVGEDNSAPAIPIEDLTNGQSN